MLRLLSSFAKRGSIVTVTERAVSRIHELLQGQSEDVIGIKLSLKKRGCSGLSYSMEFAKETQKFDEVVPVNGKLLIIDAKAVMFVLGTTMDYSWSALAEEFTFHNPNAKNLCGCGESFTV